MARYDAGRLTNKSTRSARIYKDLNLDFQQNSATKDIQKLLGIADFLLGIFVLPSRAKS